MPIHQTARSPGTTSSTTYPANRRLLQLLQADRLAEPICPCSARMSLAHPFGASVQNRPQWSALPTSERARSRPAADEGPARLRGRREPRISVRVARTGRGWLACGGSCQVSTAAWTACGWGAARFAVGLVWRRCSFGPGAVRAGCGGAVRAPRRFKGWCGSKAVEHGGRRGSAQARHKARPGAGVEGPAWLGPRAVQGCAGTRRGPRRGSGLARVRGRAGGVVVRKRGGLLVGEMLRATPKWGGP
jgi:hypothetical protein